MKRTRETPDVIKEIPAISIEFSNELLFSMNVSAIRKDVIVAESAIAPLISIMDFLSLVTASLLLLLLLSFPFNCRCTGLESIWTNLAIIKVTITAAGAIKKNVTCHPKFWIILAPTSNPTIDPPEAAELKTPTGIASFSGGNESLIILKATGIAAKPTPWTTLLARRKDMCSENPPAITPTTYNT